MGESEDAAVGEFKHFLSIARVATNVLIHPAQFAVVVKGLPSPEQVTGGGGRGDPGAEPRLCGTQTPQHKLFLMTHTFPIHVSLCKVHEDNVTGMWGNVSLIPEGVEQRHEFVALKDVHSQ